EIRVVAAEIALADEPRVSRPQKHTFMSGDWLSAKVGFGDGHDVVVERHDERGPNEGIEWKRLDACSAGNHMARRVDMCARVRSECQQRHVGAATHRHVLLRLDLNLGVT